MGKDPLLQTFDDFIGGYYHQQTQTNVASPQLRDIS
jgi:hypothetical protein